MQVFDLFSKRNKDFRFDVLEYDSLPQKLRNQIYYIWKYALAFDFSRSSGGKPDIIFKTLRDAVCREHGLTELQQGSYTFSSECEYYLKKGTDTEILLDLIELSIRLIPVFRKSLERHQFHTYHVTMNHEEAIQDLNNRFKENGVGYEFTNGILIRKDSELLHEKATKPALHLLQEQGFEGALDEFLEAHDHFRKGQHKACIISASNSFESTMRTICAKEGWEVKGTGTSSQLINALVENELIPSYLDTHVNSLRNMLAGISNVRNKKAGHGQGEEAVSVPEHFVNYTLHLCATNIVFLIESYKAERKTV